MSDEIAAPLSRLEEFRRGWKPLVAATFGIGLGFTPIPPYASGIMASALEKEFAWNRADILATLMFVPVLLVILGRFVGRMVDKYGARKVALLSTAGLGLAQLLLTTIDGHKILFQIFWGILALTALGTLPTTYARVINGWFDRARGMALGLAFAGTGITGAFMPSFLNSLVEQYGWQGGYVGLAILPLVIGLPVLFLWLREAPVAVATVKSAAAATGETVRSALRSYRFWSLAAGSVMLAVATGGLMPNLFPLLVDRGMDPATAAQALAGLAISVTVGRLLSGLLLDHIWASFVVALLVSPAVIALGLMLTPATDMKIVMFSVMALGLVAGAEFDLVAFMTSRYFGQKHFSELYSMQYAMFGLGAGFAPAIFGAIYDHMQNYNLIIWISLGLMAAAILILFTMGRYPKVYDSTH